MKKKTKNEKSGLVFKTDQGEVFVDKKTLDKVFEEQRKRNEEMRLFLKFLKSKDVSICDCNPADAWKMMTEVVKEFEQSKEKRNQDGKKL